MVLKMFFQVMELFSPGWRTLAGCIVEGFWAGGEPCLLDFANCGIIIIITITTTIIIIIIIVNSIIFQASSCWPLLQNTWSIGGDSDLNDNDDKNDTDDGNDYDNDVDKDDDGNDNDDDEDEDDNDETNDNENGYTRCF